MDNLNSQTKVSHKLNLVSGNCLQVQIKVAVTRKLQKLIHGLFNLVVHIELYA